MKQKRIIAWILSFAMILSLFGSVPLTASAQTEGENESVTVYFTLSRDGEFVTGNDTDRTMLAHVPVTVDYFDLADYGLEDFYRYEADAPENGGAYIGDEVIHRPTVLHLYIKMLEQYYLGGEKLKVGGDALSIEGSATSMYMKKFWGHDENLMYFIDHQYPIMKEGWGATADYLLLEDNMDIDVAMFSDWGFHNYGAFSSFDPSECEAGVGEPVSITMNGSSTYAVSGGETAEIKPMAGEDVVYARAEEAADGYSNAYWTLWDEPTDSSGKVTMSFDKPGTYLVSSTPLYQTFKSEDDLPCVAPPIAAITVTGDNGKEDTSGTENLTVLSDLYLTDGAAETSETYSMTPQFDAGTFQYTIAVPDADSSIALWGKESEAAGKVNAVSRITAEYTDIKGQYQKKEKILGSNAGLTLPGLIRADGTEAVVKITASCGASSQTYTAAIKRIPTLTDLTVTDEAGGELVLSPAFSQKTTDYTLKIPEEIQRISLNLQPKQKDCILSIDEAAAVSGEEQELDVQDGQTVRISVSQKEETAEYRITVSKKKRMTYTFCDLIDGTVVQVLDQFHHDILKEQSRQGTCTAENLLEGECYSYHITKEGYQGKSGTIEAGKTPFMISGALEKAPENTAIDKTIGSVWPNFRGNQENNGVTSGKTPKKAGETELFWAVKNGGGWSGAPSSPILVDGDLIFSTKQELIKADRFTGKVKGKGRMTAPSAFSLIPPTYADGMIFVALADGKIQAFDAKTLESLWVYRDKQKGQPNSPITCHNGYVYTGFWNSQEKSANYVCLSAADEDPAKTEEEKVPSWTYSHVGGFYWAGACATDQFVLTGAENGTEDERQETGTVYSFDPQTGTVLDQLSGIKGDVRCTIVYDKATNRYYFTSKGGKFYSTEVNPDGTFKAGSLKSMDLSALKTGKPSGSVEDSAGQSCSTPVIHNGRAYIGVSGTANLGAYTGHNLTVIDLDKWETAYQVETRGFPQASGLLTTAYEQEDGYNYIYFIENYTPGAVRLLKDKAGQKEPILDSENNGILGEDKLDQPVADTLFTPRGEQAEYSICSPVADEYGTLYFKNDSSYMMAVGSKITRLEMTREPEKTQYDAGETFDPKGMKVTASLANGLTRDVTDYVSCTGDPITEKDLEIEISYSHVGYNDKEKKIDPPAVYLPVSSVSAMEREQVRAADRLIAAIASAEDKEAAVKKAREAYDALGAKLQNYVKDKAALVTAETEIAKGKLTDVPKLKITAVSYNTLNLTWDKNASADGYEIYRSASAGSRGSMIRRISGNEATSLSNSGLSAGTVYYYSVRPYILVDGEPIGDVYSAAVSGKPVLSAAKLKAAVRSYNSVKLTWGPVSGASGYEIYRSTSKTKGFKLVKKLSRGSDVSYINSGLTSGVNYYYKIRAYRGSVYSGYSAVVYAAPKPAVPSGFKVKAGKKKAALYWKKVSGASGYVVYRAASAKGKYKAVRTIKKGTAVKYTDSKLKKGKRYYYKIRAYRTVKGKKVYSSYTKAIGTKVK